MTRSTRISLRPVRTLALIAITLCVAVNQASADSMDIQLLDGQYSTALHTLDYSQTTGLSEASRITTANSPISDALQSSPSTFASATADTFFVKASTSAYGSAEARADTSIRFAPLRDGSITVDLEFIGGGLAQFSTGLVSLVDLTISEPLWSYGWDEPIFNGNVRFECCFHAALGLEQDFLQSHEYDLTMHVTTGAAYDAQSMTIRVSGLHAVPEPDTLLLVALAIAGLVGARCARWITEITAAVSWSLEDLPLREVSEVPPGTPNGRRYFTFGHALIAALRAVHVPSFNGFVFAAAHRSQ